MIDQLCSAIRDKHVVSLRGKNDLGERTVEPHIVYEAANGNLLVDFYQTAGYSSSGDLPSWRCLIIDDIVSLNILPDHFEVRMSEGYNPSNTKRYSRIICRV